MAPTLPAACGSLPPEEAAPRAAWQSRFRGRHLHGWGLAFVCIVVSKRAWADLTPKHLA